MSSSGHKITITLEDGQTVQAWVRGREYAKFMHKVHLEHLTWHQRLKILLFKHP
jgi:hypothetical protein|tara:strand:- start:1928 stop:2089 length:162 start_codon:yes stop_codon:yes gene_type:complete